jgi:hypothetical protein
VKKYEEVKQERGSLTAELQRLKGMKADDKTSVCSSSGSHKSDDIEKEESDFVSKLLSCAKDAKENSADEKKLEATQLKQRLEETQQSLHVESKYYTFMIDVKKLFFLFIYRERAKMSEMLKQMEEELKALKLQNADLHTAQKVPAPDSSSAPSEQKQRVHFSSFEYVSIPPFFFFFSKLDQEKSAEEELEDDLRTDKRLSELRKEVSHIMGLLLCMTEILFLLPA